MANDASLLIKLLADKSNLDATLKGAEGSISNFSNSAKGLFEGMGKALAGAFAGVAIGKILMDGVMGANELAVSLGRLSVIINNFNPGIKVSTEEIKAWTNATAEGSMFIDDDLRPALERAVVKVKDYATAQGIVKEAMKLSTLTGMPLVEATDQLALAHEGFTRGLMMTAKSMGINVKEGAGYAEIIAKLTEGTKGLVAVMEGDLNVAVKKSKDALGDLLEETLVPALPVILQFIKGIEMAFKVLWTSLLITGKYIGTITGALFLIAQGKFKEAKDQTIQSVKDAKAEIEGLFKGPGAAKDAGLGLPPKPPSDKKSEAQKDEEAFTKMRQKADKERLAEQEKMLAQSLKDNETYNKALEDADWQMQLKIMENWNERLQKINDYLNQAASSLAAVTTSWLNGEKDAWKNWAEELIKQIERVILKKLFLMALDKMFGGGTGILGGILDVFTGGGGSGVSGRGVSGVSGSPQIQIITADPATTVAFINNAYGHATPKAQTGLYRNVQLGALQDNKR